MLIFTGNKKKAQMEIMGLAIVILLLTLGVLFAVRFGVLAPRSERGIRESFAETQLAANMLNSILKSTSESCGRQSLTSLYQDCAVTWGTSGGTIVCDDGTTRSCEYVEDVVGGNETGILARTLKQEWNRRYYYFACIWDFPSQECRDGKKIHEFGKECSGERERKTVPLHTDAGELIIRIDICR